MTQESYPRFCKDCKYGSFYTPPERWTAVDWYCTHPTVLDKITAQCIVTCQSSRDSSYYCGNAKWYEDKPKPVIELQVKEHPLVRFVRRLVE